MNTPIDNRITKDMKYIALYWTLGFEEIEPDIFVKKYGSTSCTISAKLGIATFDKGITIVNSYGLKLNTHKSFVVLECIDRLLNSAMIFGKLITLFLIFVGTESIVLYIKKLDKGLMSPMISVVTNLSQEIIISSAYKWLTITFIKFLKSSYHLT